MPRILIAVTALILLVYCKDKEEEAALKGEPPAAPADVSKKKLRSVPNFALPDSSGKVFQKSSFKDQAYLVHFWASWCGPCIDEIPEIIKFAKKYEGKKPPLSLVVIALDQNWEDAHKIIEKKEKLPKNVFSILDPELKSSNDFGSFQFPETYLISKEQKIITKWIGPQNWNHPHFEKVLAKYL